MSPVAFVDTNVPIYASGSAHPLKEPCGVILQMIEDNPEVFVTSAEVLQELLHRYTAMRAWPLGRIALRAFTSLMDGRIASVEPSDIAHAAMLADSHAGLAARDLVHAAVMTRLGITRIITADRGFDRLPGLVRLDPASLTSWVDTLSP